MPPKRKQPTPASDQDSPDPPTKRPSRSRPPTSIPEPAPEWPPHFKQLERVHRALNLVYTFCSSRKSLATTFESLKSAVESHTKKELTLADIAQIKFLVPNSVHFEYVDEEQLQIYVAGGTNVKDQAYSIISRPETTPSAEVLLFEFVDGDLKKPVARKLANGAREELKIPTVSTAQMPKLISKRNDKFKAAVDTFLTQCAVVGTDPVESITTKHRPLVPQKMHTDLGEYLENTIPADIPTERKTISEIIEEIKASDLYAGQIVVGGHRVIDPQEAKYGDLTFVLSQHLVNAIYTAHNITKFYSHQAEAINDLQDGHNVIVCTSTSSGKSLIYQIPVLHEMEKDRDTRAMFIFPTKALAQDQKRSLIEVLGYMTEVLGDVTVDTFDGDTPFEDRRRIRDEASVIFTNPDMLHLNILPNEEHWRPFLKNLKYVVVDELHVYNGLFGSHVAYIMLRLRRICSAVGNNAVRFVSCSATVANPESHMRTIFGLDTESVKLTDQDGSPSGRKEFLCWNTPFKDPNDPTSGRGDSLVQTARLFTQLILRGVRAIAFCRVRTVCELMLQAVRGELQKLGRNDVAQRVMSYRGGYTPQDRRRIEKEMFEGHLLGIVATNALELGVDIGSLDAVLMVNFPSSISAFRQQSGRAGRRNKDSLSVLVGGSFPIDQHYMTHPSELFSKPNTALALDLQSVRDGHLQCAAHEMPIHPLQDQKYFGAGLPELAESQLVPDLVGFYHSHPSFHPYPPRMVAIRDTEDPGYAVVDIARNIVLEELEASRAIFSLYEGGIFLHQGRTYLIRTVSTEQRIARVEAVNVSWTTSPRDFTDVDPVQTLQTCPPASFGKIKVETHVFGFFKMDKQKRILDSVDVDTPPLIEQTQGFWINMDENTLLLLRRRKINAAAAIHSAQHAVLALLPESDLRTECKAPEKEWAGKKTSRRRPARLVFYERRAGTGASRVGFGAIGGILERARERVEGCRCREGCAECCLGSRCSEGMRVVSKRGAGVVLRAVLGVEEPEEEVEVVEEKGWDSGSVVPVWSTGIGGAGRGLVLEDASDVGEPSRLANCVL